MKLKCVVCNKLFDYLDESTPISPLYCSPNCKDLIIRAIDQHTVYPPCDPTLYYEIHHARQRALGHNLSQTVKNLCF